MFLFFVRHFNDIDHLVPIAWKLISHKERVAVFGMNPRYDLARDYRLCFLASAGAVVNDLGREFMQHQGRGSRWLHALMDHCLNWEKAFRAQRPGPPAKIARGAAVLAGALGTLCYKINRLVCYRPYWARQILTQYAAQAIFFDHIMPEHYVVGTFLKAARSLGIPAVALPHGVLLYTNADTKEKAGSQRRHQKFSQYDRIVATNELRKRVLVDSGVPAQKIAVLGSARYCPEWMAQNWKIITKVLPEGENGADPLKLVFFPSKPQCKVDLERLAATIEMLAGIDGIQVMYKPHTRSAGATQLPGGGSLRDATEVLTAELCGWADAVLVVGSSVVTEALVRGKTALYLKYLHANTMLFEDMAACWTIRDEAELKQAILALRREKDVVPYKQENVARFLADVVQGGSATNDVLGRYLDFIMEIALRKPLDQSRLSGR
jgi:hypothetical protein